MKTLFAILMLLIASCGVVARAADTLGSWMTAWTQPIRDRLDYDCA